MARFVLKDPFYKKAKDEGFRARSAYKLKDIDALEDADQADEILGFTSAGLLAGQQDEG